MLVANPTTGTHIGTRNTPDAGVASMALMRMSARFTNAKIPSVSRDVHSASPVRGTPSARIRMAAIPKLVAITGAPFLRLTVASNEGRFP